MSNIATRNVKTKFSMPQIKFSPRFPKKLQLFLIVYAKAVGSIFSLIGICLGALVLWSLPFVLFVVGVVRISEVPKLPGGGWWMLAALILGLFWYPLAWVVTKWFNYEHGSGSERWY